MRDVQQIARGLVLPFTVFFSWYILGAKSTRPTLIAIFIVCIGFVLGVSGEIHTTALGTALGVASSVTTAVHAIVVKRSLNVVSGTLDLAYFQNLLSAFVILPFVFISGEFVTVIDMFTGGAEGSEGFSTFMTGAVVTVSPRCRFGECRVAQEPKAHEFFPLEQGIFGFLICIAGFLSIKVTSPISHMISAGALKPSCHFPSPLPDSFRAPSQPSGVCCRPSSVSGSSTSMSERTSTSHVSADLQRTDMDMSAAAAAVSASSLS